MEEGCFFSSSSVIPLDEELPLLLLVPDDLLPEEAVVEPLPALGCRPELLEELLTASRSLKSCFPRSCSQ